MQRRAISIIDALLLALLALGIIRATERVGLPFHFETRTSTGSETALFIEHKNKSIHTIGRLEIHNAAELEFYLSKFRIGDTVEVTYSDTRSESIVLVGYYNFVYTIIQSLTIFCYAFLGFFIFRRKSDSSVARWFHHLTLTLAILISHPSGVFIFPSSWISVILEIIFNLAYAIAGVFFLQFILTFARYTGKVKKYILATAYIFGLALATITSVSFIIAHDNPEISASFDTYNRWLSFVRLYFAASFICGLVILTNAIRTCNDSSLKKQLQWVLYGCTISILSYIILWQVPLILNARDIISEETMLLLSVIAPISIAIGIVRHRLFDIDLIIRKSISYALVLVIIISIYIGAVTGMTSLAQQFNSANRTLPAAAAAILAALMFEPLRRKTFAFIDRKFFRTSYDFRHAQKQFLDDIKQALDLRSLGKLVINRIQQLMPVERIGFFIMNEDVRRMSLLAHEGFDILEHRGVTFTPEDLKTGLQHPVALPEFVEGAVIEVADRPTFERWKIAVVVPMLNEPHKPLGFLVLGKRRSEKRFTEDDIELLTQVAAQTAIALGRLILQQELLLEQAESRRLDELNRLKSYFVSSVTHDLKTPLTSIRLFAELLRPALSDEKKQSYLTTIEDETERLARLITNVLDFARIEQGTKAYALRPLDLVPTVRDAVDRMRSHIESLGFSLQVELPDYPLMIEGDRDALIGVIINLISNALKYSEADKYIGVSITKQEHTVLLKIIDHGIGMKQEVLEHIFQPFFRVSQHSGSGAGLGLSIVKHTVDAHKAAMRVESEPGIGTTFTLSFNTT